MGGATQPLCGVMEVFPLGRNFPQEFSEISARAGKSLLIGRLLAGEFGDDSQDLGGFEVVAEDLLDQFPFAVESHESMSS